MAITAHSAYSPESMVFPNSAKLELYSEHRISSTHIKYTAVEEANKDENRQKAFNRMSLELHCDSVDVAPKIELGKSRNGLPTLRIGSATIVVDNYLKKHSLIDHQLEEIRETLYQQELTRGKKLPTDAGLVTYEIPVEELPEKHRWVHFCYVLELLKLQKHDPKKHNYCVLSALLTPDQKVRILTRRLDGGISTTTSLASTTPSLRRGPDKNDNNEGERPAAAFDGEPSIVPAFPDLRNSQYGVLQHSAAPASHWMVQPQMSQGDLRYRSSFTGTSRSLDYFGVDPEARDLPGSADLDLDAADKPAAHHAHADFQNTLREFYEANGDYNRLRNSDGDDAWTTREALAVRNAQEADYMQAKALFVFFVNKHNERQRAHREATTYPSATPDALPTWPSHPEERSPRTVPELVRREGDIYTIKQARRVSPGVEKAFEPIPMEDRDVTQSYHRPNNSQQIWNRWEDLKEFDNRGNRKKTASDADGYRFKCLAPAPGESNQSRNYAQPSGPRYYGQATLATSGRSQTGSNVIGSPQFGDSPQGPTQQSYYQRSGMGEIETGMRQATIEDDDQEDTQSIAKSYKSKTSSSSRRSRKSHRSQREERSQHVVTTQVFSDKNGAYVRHNGESKYLNKITDEELASLGQLYIAIGKETKWVDELTAKERTSLGINKNPPASSGTDQPSGTKRSVRWASPIHQDEYYGTSPELIREVGKAYSIDEVRAMSPGFKDASPRIREKKNREQRYQLPDDNYSGWNWWEDLKQLQSNGRPDITPAESDGKRFKYIGPGESARPSDYYEYSDDNLSTTPTDAYSSRSATYPTAPQGATSSYGLSYSATPTIPQYSSNVQTPASSGEDKEEAKTPRDATKTNAKAEDTVEAYAYVLETQEEFNKAEAEYNRLHRKYGITSRTKEALTDLRKKGAELNQAEDTYNSLLDLARPSSSLSSDATIRSRTSFWHSSEPEPVEHEDPSTNLTYPPQDSLGGNQPDYGDGYDV